MTGVTSDGADDGVDPAAFARARDLLREHLGGDVARQEWVQAVEEDPSIPRWYVRFGCEGRDAATIYFDLHQRSLHYEVYFLPDPPARREELYRVLLAHNRDLYSARFSLGSDGDLYLTGRVLLEHLDRRELDRVIGVVYQAVETWFPGAVALAFPRPPSAGRS